MNPAMFCKKISGMPRWSHSSMKCAPLSADSENSTPLLATMPTGCPYSRANPVTRVVPYSCLNSRNEPPSTTRRMISCASYGVARLTGTMSASSSVGRSGATGSSGT